MQSLCKFGKFLSFDFSVYDIFLYERNSKSICYDMKAKLIEFSLLSISIFMKRCYFSNKSRYFVEQCLQTSKHAGHDISYRLNWVYKFHQYFVNVKLESNTSAASTRALNAQILKRATTRTFYIFCTRI